MFSRTKNAPEVREEGLPDPGVPIVLILKTDLNGISNIQYKGEPQWAIAVLREVAAQIEEQINE